MTYRLLCEGRGFYFTDHPGVGPLVVTRRGGSAAQPSPRHPLWRAIALWRSQGARLAPDGTCLYDAKAPRADRSRRFRREVRAIRSEADPSPGATVEAA